MKATIIAESIIAKKQRDTTRQARLCEHTNTDPGSYRALLFIRNPLSWPDPVRNKKTLDYKTKMNIT